jgi:hypothetical protein
MIVRLSALRAVHPLPQRIFLVLISVRGYVNPQCNTATGRIEKKIEKKFNDLMGNRIWKM